MSIQIGSIAPDFTLFNSEKQEVPKKAITCKTSQIKCREKLQNELSQYGVRQNIYFYENLVNKEKFG